MKEKFCTNRKCRRKINSYNRVKGRPRCKMCEKASRLDLTKRKIEAQIVKFLSENPNVVRIKKYENKYLISNEGIVYSATKTKIKELSRVANKGGYYSVALFNNGKRNLQKIHRLVAYAFIPNDYPYLKRIINHKDGVKTNNHYTNLEWCTYRHNSRHASKMGLILKGEDVNNSKLTEKQVLEIFQQKNRKSYAKLAKEYNVSLKTIVSIMQGKAWKHVKRIKPKRRLLCNRVKKENKLDD